METVQTDGDLGVTAVVVFIPTPVVGLLVVVLVARAALGERSSGIGQAAS